MKQQIFSAPQSYARKPRLGPCLRFAVLSLLLPGCGPKNEVSHREALLVWQALADAGTLAPITLTALAGQDSFRAPIACAYAGDAQSYTLHTFVAADADPAAPGELTSYVRYQLQRCQAHQDAPQLSGSLRRGVQHRRVLVQGPTSTEATGGGPWLLEESSYDHLTGELVLSGAVQGRCSIDLHRSIASGERPHYQGTLCGLPADHVAR